MNYFNVTIAAVFAVWMTLAVSAETEYPTQQQWNLNTVLRFESANHWAGSRETSQITVGKGPAEGQSCIQAAVAIEPGHFVRIEKNFVADCHRGFRNMMAFGMVDEDLSPYNAITFQYKTDIKPIAGIIFRVYDREGGWIEWQMPLPDNADWQPVKLTIPSHAWPVFNLHRWGGILWEIVAGEKSAQGEFCIAEFQLLTDCHKGIEGAVSRPPKVDHKAAIKPPLLHRPQNAPEFHLIMNMTGEIGHAMAAHQTDLAIQRLAEAVAVFKDIEGLEYFIMPEAWFIKKFPTDQEVQTGRHPDLAEWLTKVQATYVAMAQWFEERKIGFYVGICHSADHQPLIPVDIVQACIDVAPQTCRGVVMGEFSLESNGGIDETLATMRLLKRCGLKLLYFQQSHYWFGIMMPAGNEFRQKLMAPEFKDVFVPMGEYVVPSAQGLSWASLIGMRQGGLVNDWGMSVQSWGYANMNWGGTSDQPGSYWLRLFLTTAAFGGRYIEIEPKWAFDGENVPGQVEHFKQWAHNLRWVGRRRAQVDIDLDPSDPMRALMLFHRLIRENAIVPAAAAEKVVSISPAAFKAEHTPNWGMWDLFHRAMDKNFYDMCCPNYTDMSAQTPPQDAFSYLYGSNHFYDQTFPQTDYGLISILPMEAKNRDDAVFKTDGQSVYYDEQTLSAAEAKTDIRAAFETASKKLPLIAKGCAWSAVEISDGDYLVAIMDAEERFPKGCKATLIINLPGDWIVMDGVTSAPLQPKGGEGVVEVLPAGFRIIRVLKNLENQNELQ